MPGKPGETFIGVSIVGVGAVLAFAAYKNKSPIALIRNAVTTGSLDLSAIPPLVGGPNTVWHWPPAVDEALKTIAVKDPVLSAEIRAELMTFDSKTAYSKTKHFFDLMSEARSKGYGAQVDTMEQYVNNLIPASTTTGGTVIQL